MTELMKAALERIDRLPAEEQDRLARFLLDELESESRWDERYRSSQDQLRDLAERARAEIARGEVRDEDPGMRRRG